MGVAITAAGFAVVPYELMESYRDPFIWAVYACLHRHGWGSKDGCWASIPTIANETGMGDRKVRTVLKLLRMDGWIEAIERTGATTIHRLRTELPKARRRAAHPPKPSSGRAAVRPSTMANRTPENRPDHCGATDLGDSTMAKMQTPLQNCNQSAVTVANLQREIGPDHCGARDLEEFTLANLQSSAQAGTLCKTGTTPVAKLQNDRLQKCKTNKNPRTKTQEQEPFNPPLTPPRGGDGLAAVAHTAQQLQVVDALVDERPTAERPTAEQPAAEQPSASALVTAKRSSTRRSSRCPSREDAARLMEVWNKNRPAGWGALRCVNESRWAVAMTFSRDLGGFDAFLEALPVALANAGQDRFWCAPGHDWNSFMGYGPGSGKGHFHRFLEQECPSIPTLHADGSLTAMGLIIQTHHNPTPKLF